MNSALDLELPGSIFLFLSILLFCFLTCIKLDFDSFNSDFDFDALIRAKTKLGPKFTFVYFWLIHHLLVS